MPTEELGTYMYFKSLLAGVEDRIEPTCIYVNPLPEYETVTVLDDPIKEYQEVRAAISSLKKNKAPGLDSLTPTVFKQLSGHLITFTTTLFNKLLEEGTFPDSWSSGAIKPIHKKREIEEAQVITGLPVATLYTSFNYFSQVLRLCQS